MCILFIHVDNTPPDTRTVSSSPYKLILASNRDESLLRPTKPAYFWDSQEKNSEILAGQDLKDYGTWLGISRHGKVGVLLNIMGGDSVVLPNKSFESRGSLVTGFLRSPPALLGCTYLKNLCHADMATKYRPFQMVTIDLIQSRSEQLCKKQLAKDTTVCVNYLAHEIKKDGLDNKEENCCPIGVREISSPLGDTCAFYGFGNSHVDRPFEKVSQGKDEFERVIKGNLHSEVNDENREENLVQELMGFLKSTKQYYPDKVIDKQAERSKIPKQWLPYFGARCVTIPDRDYGTRTHTVVLVDTMNNVTFHEWTMKDPIDRNNPEWIRSKYTFQLSNSS